MSVPGSRLVNELALPPPVHLRLWQWSVRILRGERPLLAIFRSFGAQALILAMNVTTGIVTARMLGPAGRGIYVAVTLWPPVLSTLAMAGLGSAVIFRLRRCPENVGSIAGAALLLGALSSMGVTAIGSALLPAFMTRYAAPTVLFAQVCLVNVWINSSQAVIKQTFAGTGRYWYCNLTHLLPQLFHLSALLAIVIFATLTPRKAAMALLLSSGAAVLVMLPRFMRVARPRLRGSLLELRQLTSYSARAATTDVVFTLATYSDRLVLIPLLSASELGFYAVAFSFSRVIQFVQPAVVSVFFSHLSAQSDAEASRLHDYAYRFLAACLVAGCGIFWLAGPFLLGLAYGPEFTAANTIFQLLVIEASLGVLSQVTVQLFLSRNRPGIVSAIQAAVLCCSVAALLLLVPRYGAVGAALSLLGAGTVRWLLLLGAMKGILRLPLPRLYPSRGDFQYVLGRLH